MRASGDTGGLRAARAAATSPSAWARACRCGERVRGLRGAPPSGRGRGAGGTSWRAAQFSAARSAALSDARAAARSEAASARLSASGSPVVSGAGIFHRPSADSVGAEVGVSSTGGTAGTSSSPGSSRSTSASGRFVSAGAAESGTTSSGVRMVSPWASSGVPVGTGGRPRYSRRNRRHRSSWPGSTRSASRIARSAADRSPRWFAAYASAAYSFPDRSGAGAASGARSGKGCGAWPSHQGSFQSAPRRRPGSTFARSSSSRFPSPSPSLSRHVRIRALMSSASNGIGFPSASTCDSISAANCNASSLFRPVPALPRCSPFAGDAIRHSLLPPMVGLR